MLQGLKKAGFDHVRTKGSHVAYRNSAEKLQMNIRGRRRADLERCTDVLAAVHHADAYPLNWPADPYGWLCPEGLLNAWIAENAGATVAGHLALVRLKPPVVSDLAASRPLAAVSRLFVAPTFRRQSVGRRLLAQAQEWAGARELDLILDVVDSKRSGAVALYEATGWQFTHLSQAGWTAPDGEPVWLRHYRYPPEAGSVRTAGGGRGAGTG
ncbi:MAG TPA: GNAT family N-acetyltransferase [Micromonosporaceae bacterium]|nr:GNAT family N-acetyltransferase [Micromonosporaceae bacterium]